MSEPLNRLRLIECARLAHILKQDFRFLDILRELDPLAQHIQYPKIPGILGESLAVELGLRGVLLKDYDFLHRGGIADVTAIRGQTKHTVEVKSTGMQGFISEIVLQRVTSGSEPHPTLQLRMKDDFAAEYRVACQAVGIQLDDPEAG